MDVIKICHSDTKNIIFQYLSYNDIIYHKLDDQMTDQTWKYMTIRDFGHMINDPDNTGSYLWWKDYYQYINHVKEGRADVKKFNNVHNSRLWKFLMDRLHYNCKPIELNEKKFPKFLSGDSVSNDQVLKCAVKMKHGDILVLNNCLKYYISQINGKTFLSRGHESVLYDDSQPEEMIPILEFPIFYWSGNNYCRCVDFNNYCECSHSSRGSKYFTLSINFHDLLINRLRTKYQTVDKFSTMVNQFIIFTHQNINYAVISHCKYSDIMDPEYANIYESMSDEYSEHHPDLAKYLKNYKIDEKRTLILLSTFR